MTRVLIGIIVIGIAQSLAASADESLPLSPKVLAGCTTDFRLDAKGKSLADVYLHNQGPVPNCYAQTSALIYDAWGLSHPFPIGYSNRKHRASPYWATAGSPIEKSLNFFLNQGSCDETAYTRWVTTPTKHRQTTWEYEDQFNENYSRLVKIWNEAQGADDETVQRLALDFNWRVANYIFAAGKGLQYEDAYKVLKAPNVDMAVQAAFAPLCNSSEYFEKLAAPAPTIDIFTQDQRDTARTINEVWNREIANPQPVGIAICAESFTDPAFTIPRGGQTLNWDGCGGHAVTLIGRRWSEARGQCEFLLRNSWGYSCDSYDASSVVECEDSTKQVWISSAWIGRAVQATVHLK